MMKHKTGEDVVVTKKIEGTKGTFDVGAKVHVIYADPSTNTYDVSDIEDLSVWAGNVSEDHFE